MSFKLQLLMLWFALSVFAGVVTRPLLPNQGEGDSHEKQDLASIESGLGGGVTLAALGGYRSIAANFVWLKMYDDWRYRRESDVLEKMELAVSLNPSVVYFWLDGARIIANDMPVWVVGDEEMDSLFDDSSEEGRSVRVEYAKQALAFLDRAPGAISSDYRIPLEKGIVYWKRLQDLDNAIVCFKEAADVEGSPYFVARVCAELLYRNGQKEEAYEYLSEEYEKLPDGDERAMKPIIAKKLEELKKELSR